MRSPREGHGARLKIQKEAAPAGSTFQECYDVTSGRLRPDYVLPYEQAKEELASMGVPLS